MGVSCECHFPVKSIFVLFFGLLRFSSVFTPLFRCPFVQSLLPFCLFIYEALCSSHPPTPPLVGLPLLFLRVLAAGFLFSSTSQESLANALHYFVLYCSR